MKYFGDEYLREQDIYETMDDEEIMQVATSLHNYSPNLKQMRFMITHQGLSIIETKIREHYVNKFLYRIATKYPGETKKYQDILSTRGYQFGVGPDGTIKEPETNNEHLYG